MKTRNYVLVLVALLALIGTTMLASAQTTASSSATAAASLTPTYIAIDYAKTGIDRNLQPGDSGILQIVIMNTGNQNADNVQVTVQDTTTFFVSKSWSVGRVGPLEEKVVTGTIRVAPDATPGLHDIQVQIVFDGYDSEGDRDNNQRVNWDLPIRVFGNANFQAQVAGDKEFLNGFTQTLTLTGTTKDGARDVTATISSSCASIIGSSKVYLATINKGQTFNLTYMIQPSAVGICPMNLLINYSDSTGNGLSDIIPLGIDVKRYDVDFKINNVITTGATPGSDANITLVIDNVGSADASDVSVSLNLSTPIVAVGSPERFVGDIKSGGESQVNFGASVDSTADIQSYSVAVTITYFDISGNKQNVSKSIGIEVSGQPDIKLVLQSADLFTTGTKGKVTVNVVNKGFAGVNFLDLTLMSTDQYDVTSSSEVYIGNLDSDSTDSQDFTIQLKGNVTPGQVPLKFQVAYKEKNSNVQHSDPVNVPLTVLTVQDYASRQPAGSAISLIITIVGAIIALVVGVIVLWLVYKIITSVISMLDRKFFKRKAQ